MKTLLLLSAALGFVAFVAACDRAPSPTDAAPRTVRGTVEVKLGDQIQRYDLRVDRIGDHFTSALRPLGRAGSLAHRLERLPFVRDSVASGAPIVMQTPGGVIETRFAYRTLGPWQVLDRAVTSLRVNAPGGPQTIDLEVALRGARLER